MSVQRPILLALLALTACAGAAPDDDDDPELSPRAAARYEAIFDVTPPAGTPDLALTPTKIRNRLIQLIEQADQGAFIRASMYMLFGYCDTGLVPGDLNGPCDDDRLLNALADAIEQRGVHFWLVNEGPGGDSDEGLTGRNRRFVDALRDRLADTGTQGRFHEVGCVNGCILSANGHIDHNKTWIFSSVGGEPVVLQTSENFTYGQYRVHQQAVVVKGDETLYFGYLRYFNHQLCSALTDRGDLGTFADFYAEYCDPGFDAEVTYAHRTRTSGTTVAHFMPIRNGDDVVMDRLSRINPAKPCQIHVAMSLWTNARENVASKLKQLAGAGCTVKAIIDTGAASDVALSKFGKVTVIRKNLHSKYMLVNATLDGVATKLVASGSHTFSGTWKSSDDAWLEIQDASLYAAFLANWNAIRVGP